MSMHLLAESAESRCPGAINRCGILSCPEKGSRCASRGTREGVISRQLCLCRHIKYAYIHWLCNLSSINPGCIFAMSSQGDGTHSDSMRRRRVAVGGMASYIGAPDVHKSLVKSHSGRRESIVRVLSGSPRTAEVRYSSA